MPSRLIDSISYFTHLGVIFSHLPPSSLSSSSSSPSVVIHSQFFGFSLSLSLSLMAAQFQPVPDRIGSETRAGVSVITV